MHSISGLFMPAIVMFLCFSLSFSVSNSLLRQINLTRPSFLKTKMEVMVGSSTVSFFAFYAACIFILAEMAKVQSVTGAVTDPAEVRALNSIFQKWSISATPNQWNISGEPCSGAAIDSTSLDYGHYNPLIKCDCSYDNNATCHITQLKVYALDVVGVIPEELWTLTFLTNLNLGQNYLTGSLSSSIRYLTRMQRLNIGINALSGVVPKELGELTDLRSLSFSSNNFSGSLPFELGDLVDLYQIYFHSSGVSGEIPSTFANLRNLKTMWASDTELTGRIPDFIGNLSKLTALRLRGNSFEGPIPPTFSSLTSLTELMISDLSNGSSSLAFIKDMKSLRTLVLRNNNISDSLPSSIGKYKSLMLLDLSFNDIIGQIPDSLFKLSSLAYLFLGNNRLSGTLPAQKVANLLNIDLSYNNLEGSFPSWVSQQNLQLNIVGNNFNSESSNGSTLPSGWNCLQRSFPCNRGPRMYNNFGINCGGPQIAFSDGFIYEGDNETLGPATYYVINTNRWAVSNVGYFMGTNNPKYTSGLSSQFTNALDSQLFQTARISASSLRYYGLGIENGNYNIRLQFAETAILRSSKWESLRRRIFDIYIQGKLVLKNFDTQKEAGGVSFRAIQKEFRVQVSENYLEIHLFWAGKGTCCMPSGCTYGPSISGISVTPDFIPTAENNPPSTKRNSTGLILGAVFGAGVLSFLSRWCCFQRKQRPADDGAEIFGTTRPCLFSYDELKTATNNFAPENKLGEGGFGTVYKGKLGDERVIAVKKLAAGSNPKTEIKTISSVQHCNIVQLYGCCNKGDNKLLVYEFVENGSLHEALFGDGSLNLNWSKRKEICLGVAKGLAYLHEESRLKIIHRDVKASNILLDKNYLPKISDFGLAWPFDDTKTHEIANPAGTIGYWAPEYFSCGRLSKEADVYSFGVVVQEIVSGRKCCDLTLEEDRRYLPKWALHLHKNNSEVDLVDSRLEEVNIEEVKHVIKVSLMCTQEEPNKRPSMSGVVKMLSDIPVGAVTSRPCRLSEINDDDAPSRRSLVAVGRVGPEPPPGPSREQPATAEDMEINQYDQSERVGPEPPPGPSREQPATSEDMEINQYDQSERIVPEPPPGPSREQSATAEDMEINQYDRSERIVPEPPPGPSREQPATAGAMEIDSGTRVRWRPPMFGRTKQITPAIGLLCLIETDE